MLVNLAGEGQLSKFYDLTMPNVSRPLSNLDWRILEALRGNAMRTLPAIARQIGVSAKTVKRRFDLMSEEGSFLVVPQLNPSEAEGVLLFYLGFFFDSEGGRGTISSINKAYSDTYISVDSPQNMGLGSYALMVAARSMSGVDKLRRRGEGIKGVAKVATWLFRDAHESYEWVDEASATA